MIQKENTDNDKAQVLQQWPNWEIRFRECCTKAAILSMVTALLSRLPCQLFTIEDSLNAEVSRIEVLRTQQSGICR